jgi:hypothetical protein
MIYFLEIIVESFKSVMIISSIENATSLAYGVHS